jgi:hypothetical protein
MKSIVFLFGAGASYGAGGTLPEQPPLGFQLYSILENIYPGSWGAFPIDIKDIFRWDFEQGMQFIYDNYAALIPQLMREMAIYFIQFRPYRNSTLYCRLISDLNDSGLLGTTLFSTLNYECVLEFSLLEQGHMISYFAEGNGTSIPVWKLHGSCNMFSHEVQAGQDISYGTGIVWEGGVQAFLDANKVIQHCLIETALAPVMCLYMRGKLLSVSPSAIRQLQRDWVERVKTASAIVCIGVRPLPEDTHIWEPLGTTNARFYFIGDRGALEAWCESSRRDNTEYLGDRFNMAYKYLMQRLQTHGTYTS